MSLKQKGTSSNHKPTKKQCLEDGLGMYDEYDECDKCDKWLESDFARLNVKESGEYNFQDFFGDIFTALQKGDSEEVQVLFNKPHLMCCLAILMNT